MRDHKGASTLAYSDWTWTANTPVWTVNTSWLDFEWILNHLIEVDWERTRIGLEKQTEWLWAGNGLITMASAVCFVENDESSHCIFAQSESGHSGIGLTCCDHTTPVQALSKCSLNSLLWTHLYRHYRMSVRF